MSWFMDQAVSWHYSSAKQKKGSYCVISQLCFRWAYHQATLSPYHGTRGPVITVDSVSDAKAVANSLIANLKPY